MKLAIANTACLILPSHVLLLFCTCVHAELSPIKVHTILASPPSLMHPNVAAPCADPLLQAPSRPSSRRIGLFCRMGTPLRQHMRRL